MIKNIIFDNGGVIVKYSASTYLNYFNFDKKVEDDLNTLFSTDKWVELSKGIINDVEFLEYCISVFPHYKKEIEMMLSYDNIKYLLPVYNETLNFIDRLKLKGYKVYLLSDIIEDTIRYMNEVVPSFESLFDGIVYSCRVGMVKKEGMVFDYILKEYNLDPEETLFLDDSITNINEANKRCIVTYRIIDPIVDIPNIEKNILK